MGRLNVDKFPHTKRGIRRTSYPLVPCGNCILINSLKMGEKLYFLLSHCNLPPIYHRNFYAVANY